MLWIAATKRRSHRESGKDIHNHSTASPLRAMKRSANWDSALSPPSQRKTSLGHHTDKDLSVGDSGGVLSDFSL
jgi:hypothetical protein